MCACTALPGESDSAGRLRHRVRRHHRAAAGAARRGLGRGRAPSRARDQEPADADPAVGRAHAPQVLKADERGEAQMLDRATHTIIQQVEAMKEMVNAFSEYARTPEHGGDALRPERADRRGQRAVSRDPRAAASDQARARSSPTADRGRPRDACGRCCTICCPTRSRRLEHQPEAQVADRDAAGRTAGTPSSPRSTSRTTGRASEPTSCTGVRPVRDDASRRARVSGSRS